MKEFITIDGKVCEFKEGETILDIARRNRIYIPVLCYFKDITETGACRICLVEVKGIPVPMAACASYAVNGMVVYTDTEEVRRNRLKALEFILLKHPLECGRCENNGDCQLQRIAKMFGVSEVKETSEQKPDIIDDWNMFKYNRTNCVLCQRCAKVCHDVAGCNALEIVSRGHETHMEPAGGDTLDCDFCGICADVCPVGAITDKAFDYSVKVWGLTNIHTACTFCPAGCRLNYGTYGGKIHRVRCSGDEYTCSKGRYGFTYMESPKRLKFPIIKTESGFAKTTWGEAGKAFYDSVMKYGAENTLIACGSRLTNEELFIYASFAKKTGMKFITEAEIYFGSFMRKFKDKFGHYESLGRLSDIENSELIFVIGADFARECVGIKWRVTKAAMKNNAKIISIGLHKYEYDEITYAGIIADYGDFAGEFEKIKNADENRRMSIYSSIKNYIGEAKSVAVIVGNEYFESEEQEESVLSFADFIGRDKLKVFMAANDKVNYVGALYMGGITAEEAISLNPKVVFAVSVNPGRGKLEPLKNIIDKAEFYVSPDLFISGSLNKADIIFPVQASLEGSGTYITIDGRLNRKKSVCEPPTGTRSNLHIVEQISLLFRKKSEMEPDFVFRANADKFGFKAEDLDHEEDVYLKKESVFNKTEYEYKTHDKKEKIVYINPRQHEGAMSRILERDPEDFGLPLFSGGAGVKKEDSSILNDETAAKGIKLIIRG